MHYNLWRIKDGVVVKTTNKIHIYENNKSAEVNFITKALYVKPNITKLKVPVIILTGNFGVPESNNGTNFVS